MSIKVQVSAGHRQCEIEMEASESLADRVDDSGIKFPFGCRSGSCGVCRVTVLEGEDLLQPPLAVEEDTISRCEEPGVRLVCRAKFKVDAKGSLIIQSAV